MSIDLVKLGSTFIATVSFKNSDGTAFVPSKPASYQILDFNNKNIISGIGEQDSIDPYIWKASITLPNNAPFSPNSKYSIIWKIFASNGSVCTQVEYFNVDSPGDIPIDYEENGDVVLSGGSVNDSLVVPYNGLISYYRVNILDDTGLIYWTTTNSNPSTPMNVDDNNVYSINTGNLSSLVARGKPYIIQWIYTIDGKQRSEYHFIYVCNLKIIRLMEMLRSFIDKVRFTHPNVNLRYTDLDLINYLVQGCQIVNYTKPMFTSFNLNMFPQELEYFLINAGAFVALSSQFIAEGASAFELSGQSVSLTVDRSQSIESALGRITQILENQLPTAKKMISLSAVSAVLTITPSPSLNSKFLSLSGRGNFDLGFPGDYVSRDSLYSSILTRLSESYMFDEAYSTQILGSVSSNSNDNNSNSNNSNNNGGNLNNSNTPTVLSYPFAPTTLFSINHNLNRNPNVTIIDSSGQVVIGDIWYIDLNKLYITFSTATGGTVNLN